MHVLIEYRPINFLHMFVQEVIQICFGYNLKLTNLCSFDNIVDKIRMKPYILNKRFSKLQMENMYR